jgi:30S ribosomal protein S31
MGKGDKRSKRGKIFAGSYGKSRPKATKKHTAAKAKDAKGKGE